MKQKHRTLTTEVKSPTRMANHKPRTIRILPITDYYGKQTRYYMGRCPLPVPAWMRHLDGWSVQGVVALIVLALIGASMGVAMLLRLLGQASTVAGSGRLTAEPGTAEHLRQLLEIAEKSEHPMDKALTPVLRKQIEELEEKGKQR